MRSSRSLDLPFVFLAILGFAGGCATLPDVSETIHQAPVSGSTPEIISARASLTLKQRQALMARLNQSIEPTDIVQRFTAVIESVSDTPLTKGNRVTLLIDGPSTFAAMFQAVRNARDHINVETFKMEDIEGDKGATFADLLLQKQKEGVQVNLIYDSLGSVTTPAAFFQRLRDGGIAVVEFDPINPFKTHGKWRLATLDHRKILIVDGKVVFTGGVNISKVYSSGLSAGKKGRDLQMPWRDTDVRIEGPVVAEFQKMFLDTWKSQKGTSLSPRDYFPSPREDGKVLVEALGSRSGESNRLTFVMYIAAITFAQNSLHMTNAYFVPDHQALKALAKAARRGVDVKIILPGVTDSALAEDAGEYFYSRLLKAGVKLYKRRSALLHAKTLVIDGVWSTVGSTNMDFWSFSSNDEVNAVILNPEFAVSMENMFTADLKESDEIRWQEWKRRPMSRKIKEWFLHLFGHWL